jgi:hypothetical protein
MQIVGNSKFQKHKIEVNNALWIQGNWRDLKKCCKWRKNINCRNVKVGFYCIYKWINDKTVIHSTRQHSTPNVFNNWYSIFKISMICYCPFWFLDLWVHIWILHWTLLTVWRTLGIPNVAFHLHWAMSFKFSSGRRTFRTMDSASM